MKKNIPALFTISAIVLFFCLPFLVNIKNIYFEQQWLDNCSFQAFVRKSMLEFKQFPFWSPYFGGGYPFQAHPESLSLSPFIIYFLLFGAWAGYKLFFLTGYLFGGIGMFFLARKAFNYNIKGALYSALLFSLTSFFPYHLHTGNFYLANFFYFPWLLLFFIKAQKDNLSVLFSAAILAFLIFNGMALYWMTVVLFLSFFAILESLFEIRRKAPVFKPDFVLRLGIIILFAILLGAVKIFPLLELLAKNSRTMHDYNAASAYSLNLNNFFLSLFSKGPYKKPMDWFPDGNYADPVMYFGFIPAAFCLLSFWAYRKQKEIKIFFILLAVFILLAFGKNSPIDFFKALWHLPLFHSMHNPNRYFSFYIMFIIALIAGKIFGGFKKNNRLINASLILLAVFSLNDMFWANRKYQEGLFKTAPLVITPEKGFYQIKTYNSPVYPRGHISTEPDSYQYFWLLRNVGKINSICDLDLSENAIPKFYVNEVTGEKNTNPDYRGEAYFLDKDNKAEIRYFSPNVIFIDADVNKPDCLVVNQNYSNYWNSNFGRVIDSHGLIGIHFHEKGEYHIKLSYCPFSFYGGMVVSLVTLIILIAVFKRREIIARVSK